MTHDLETAVLGERVIVNYASSRSGLRVLDLEGAAGDHLVCLLENVCNLFFYNSSDEHPKTSAAKLL